MPSSQPSGRRAVQAGDRGVRRVGHVRPAPVENPGDPRVDGAEAEVAVATGIEAVEQPLHLGRRLVRRDRSRLARRPRHSPIVRRSCQPRPGPTASPVARSHTIVDPRWLEMPTASTGPAAASAARARRRGRRPPSRPRRTPRGRRRESRGGAPALLRARTCRRRATTAARTLLVPTSTTSTLPFVIGLRPGEIAERRGEPELAGVEDAVRVERVLDRARARRSPRRARRRRSARG